MTDNGTMIATLGRIGSGAYQAAKGLLWAGSIPTVVTRPDVVVITSADLLSCSTATSDPWSVTITGVD